MNQPYLPAGLPEPEADNEGLSAPYWNGLKERRLLVQRCPTCGTWQFGPEWLCHRCHRFDPIWAEVTPEGVIHSWERVWHPAHPALKDRGPYLVVLIELPQAGGVRMLGNLLGDPMQNVLIGSAVHGVFEPHTDTDAPYTLLQWQLKDDA
ncbi:MAG: zinc ribbon domain-containing protein [Devosia sp.]